MRGFIVVAAVLVTFAAYSQGYPPGADRDAFISNAKKTCLAHQIGSAENDAFTVGELRGYCDCYAVNMANTVSEPIMKGRMSINSPEAQKIIALAAQICLEAIKPR